MVFLFEEVVDILIDCDRIATSTKYLMCDGLTACGTVLRVGKTLLE
jgi:hypothetical protein